MSNKFLELGKAWHIPPYKPGTILRKTEPSHRFKRVINPEQPVIKSLTMPPEEHTSPDDCLYVVIEDSPQLPTHHGYYKADNVWIKVLHPNRGVCLIDRYYVEEVTENHGH